MVRSPPRRVASAKATARGCQERRRGANSVMESKECPLCGGPMRLADRDEIDRIPGTSEVKRRTLTEWVCPECEHFEEADPEDLL